MAAAAAAVEKELQSVAQTTGWTYAILWHLCPAQGALVWAEGHYNGAVRTRKTTALMVVQPGPCPGAGEEEQEDGDGGGRRRSRQLRDLYASLARGEADADAQAPPAARRPAAALAPEDLTDAEWFYLMCASYSFPPGAGLPGEALARRGYVWLSGANHVDSKVFSRAILAKSAGIQTVLCIPVVDGVLEIGTTEKVDEDIGLVQYVRSIFMDQNGIHMMPTLSGHSTSNPIAHIDRQPIHETIMENHDTDVQPNILSPDDEHNEMEEDDDADEIAMEMMSSHQNPLLQNVNNEESVPNAGSSDLMQFQMSERLREGCSKNMDEEIQMFMACQNSNNEVGPLDFLYEDLCNKYGQSSAAEDQAVTVPPENAHYMETLVTVLRYNTRRQSQAPSKTKAHLSVSSSSSFSRWHRRRQATDHHLETTVFSEGSSNSQRMLKSILMQFIIVAPSSHPGHSSRNKGEARSPEPCRNGGACRLRRGQVQAAAEVGASNVVKERRRREKLNERFVILRSLVPFVTKMDRASILGDTIEYVKQLRRRVQDLESSPRSRPPQQTDGGPTTAKRAHGTGGAALLQAGEARSKRAARPAAEAMSSSCSTSSGGAAAAAEEGSTTTEVQVSIIGRDALLELRCPRPRDGLLLRVMEALHRDLGLEVTSVQASSAGGVLLAQLRAEVKEVHGRRSGINDVKRAIHLILASESD